MEVGDTMRTVNENFETIDESLVDLSKGYLTKAIAIREDATPIDDITKFAWDNGDYEDVMMYCLYEDGYANVPSFEPTETEKILDVLLGV